jgi:hypothetical protein
MQTKHKKRKKLENCKKPGELNLWRPDEAEKAT